jgi:hypothetical protein
LMHGAVRKDARDAVHVGDFVSYAGQKFGPNLFGGAHR